MFAWSVLGGDMTHVYSAALSIGVIVRLSGGPQCEDGLSGRGWSSRTRIVRAIPSGGPNGSEKPIQKASSAGSSAREITVAPGAPVQIRQPTATSARHTARKPSRRGVLVGMPIPLEGAVAVGREPHERPHHTLASEVPAAEEAGQPEAESEQHRQRPGDDAHQCSVPRRPGWASSWRARVSVSQPMYFSSLHP